MTATKIIETYQRQNAELASLLLAIRDVLIAIKPYSSVLPVIEKAIAQSRGDHSSVPVATDPCPRMGSADFYAGAIDVLDYLTQVANRTQGSEVWAALFAASRINLIAECKEKGFNVR